VQVSYLGYLGTTALPAMDYVIAAPGMIPRAARRHFSEKVIELPSYQANDSQRRAADGGADRRRFGLPAAGFVFCCFNANHKLTPATFGGWMRILARVPDSVLFLGVDAPAAADNLRGAARRHGIAAERLVCAGRVPFGEYLARYGAADLFLDTLPYNAGATASDALWAGLPVLTRPGRTFAGRVAASLLTAIGLPELVATTQARYEDLAVGLATDPPRLEALRAKLAANRATAPLFDTRAFTAGLESAYVRIAQRDRAALPPAHLRIRSAPPCAAGGALHAPQG
jgi:predicted O-linked N-acetylglucosamine transferase (SPINDLY family)